MLGRYSRYARYVRDVYRREYDASDVFDNDSDVITSTLFFVELREPRSMYVL